MSEPFTIGADLWPGLAKAIEELTELTTVLGQLIAFPDGHRPDSKDLLEHLHMELGDAMAALGLLVHLNEGRLDPLLVDERCLLKFETWLDWHERERAAASCSRCGLRFCGGMAHGPGFCIVRAGEG